MGGRLVAAWLLLVLGVMLRCMPVQRSRQCAGEVAGFVPVLGVLWQLMLVQLSAGTRVVATSQQGVVPTMPCSSCHADQSAASEAAAVPAAHLRHHL